MVNVNVNKALKTELKEKCKEIKAQGGKGYINLTSASIEQMQDYIAQNAAKQEPITEEVEVEIEDDNISDLLAQIGQQTHLSKLGKLLTKLSGRGDYKDWKFTLWTKNGECRLYIVDESYRNPKERGYLLINSDGSVRPYFSARNISFPELPILPETVDDLAVLPKRVSPELAERLGYIVEHSDSDSPSDEWHFGAADEESF